MDSSSGRRQPTSRCGWSARTACRRTAAVIRRDPQGKLRKQHLAFIVRTRALVQGAGVGRDALDAEGPQRWPQKRLGREEVKAVGGGYCQLPMPLKLALAVRETVAGHRLGVLKGGWVPPPSNASLGGGGCPCLLLPVPRPTQPPMNGMDAHLRHPQQVLDGLHVLLFAPVVQRAPPVGVALVGVALRAHQQPHHRGIGCGVMEWPAKHGAVRDVGACDESRGCIGLGHGDGLGVGDGLG